MDYKTIGFAICNGDFSHTNIALARGALEYLGASLTTIMEVEDMLYAMREESSVSA